MNDSNRIFTDRIFAICIKIAAWWSDFPELRFMQLMSNFATWYGADPFYLEDDEFIKKFEEYMKSLKGE